MSIAVFGLAHARRSYHLFCAARTRRVKCALRTRQSAETWTPLLARRHAQQRSWIPCAESTVNLVSAHVSRTQRNIGAISISPQTRHSFGDGRAKNGNAYAGSAAVVSVQTCSRFVTSNICAQSSGCVCATSLSSTALFCAWSTSSKRRVEVQCCARGNHRSLGVTLSTSS